MKRTGSDKTTTPSQKASPTSQSMSQKMPPTLAPSSRDSRSSRSSSEVASQISYTVVSREDDYSSFMSDVLVVGAGPSGLVLAYVQRHSC